MIIRKVTTHTTCDWCDVEAVFQGVHYFSKVKNRWGMTTDNAVFDCESCGKQFDEQNWEAHRFTD